MNNFNEDRLRDYYDNMLLNDRYDNNAEEPIPPSTEDMTVYDLMGDDYYPYITKNSNGDYTITIENYQNEVVAENIEANMCVLDGFADFCRRYLTSYERLNQK
jgi:hypothetical protein